MKRRKRRKKRSKARTWLILQLIVIVLPACLKWCEFGAWIAKQPPVKRFTYRLCEDGARYRRDKAWEAFKKYVAEKIKKPKKKRSKSAYVHVVFPH